MVDPAPGVAALAALEPGQSRPTAELTALGLPGAVARAPRAALASAVVALVPSFHL
jgi:hypothetical protein